MTVVDLWVQAEVLPVRVRLVPAGGTGHLETLTLRAIRAGVDDVDALADIFGLPARIMLDLIGDLWREGRVTLDVGAAHESVVVTTKALEELARLDEHGSLPSGYRVSDAQQVLLDKLTGRVLPLRAGRRTPVDRSLVVPTWSAGPGREDVEHGAVVGAVIAGMEDRRTGRRADEYGGMQVADVMLAPGATTTAHRYVRMSVQASITTRDELVVAVQDEDLPLPVRELATRRLAQLLSGEPVPPLARRLRSLAAKIPYEAVSVERVVAEMQRAIQALPDCAPANRQRQHDRLTGQAQNVFAQAESLAAQEMDARLVQSQGEHQEAVRALVDDADRQLVLAVPWVTEAGLRPYLGSLTGAVRRGVEVFLLWGIRQRGDELDSGVRSHLLTLQREAAAAGRGGQVHVPEVPAYLHAKVAVADDRRALVTSRNFLSHSNLKEIGVVLDARPGEPAPLLEDLLQWAHRITPSASIADRLARHRSAFSTPDHRAPLPPVPLPEFTPALVQAASDSPVAQSWSAAWHAVTARLAEVLDRPRPVVSLVLDGYHRTLMHRALEGAAQRVVVSSDGFSAGVVTESTVAAARDAAGRGARVTFVYGRGRDEGAAERIAELKQPGPQEAPSVRQVTDHHAKVLVHDDKVVIGSFNYLSLDSSRRRGRSTGELSVLLESRPLADTVAALLERKAGDGGAAEAPAGGPTGLVEPVATVSVEVALAVQQLVGLLAGSDLVDIDAVADLLTGSGAPDEALAELGSVAGALDAERALAALVHAAPLDTEAEQKRLGAWLRSAWRRGAWWLAGEIRACLPDRFDGPSPQLSRAAAATARPLELAAMLSDLALEDALPADERDALCVLAMVVLLRSGEPALQDPISVWEVNCSPAVRRGARAVLDTVARHGALPTADLVDLVRGREASARLEDRWTELDRALHQLRRYKPKTPPGEQLLASLFTVGDAGPAPRGPGEMTELADIVHRRDAALLRGWVERYQEQDDARWVDRASGRAGLGRPVDGSQRGSFIHKHAALRQAAEDVLAATRSVGLAADLGSAHLDQLERMRTELTGIRADAPAGWAANLVRHEVDRLLDELRAEPGDTVLGARPEEWRFPRLVLEDGAAEDPMRRCRLLAADLCASWTPRGVVSWLGATGEYALADTMRAVLFERRLIPAAENEDLDEQVARVREDDLATAKVRWSLLRAQGDRAGVAVPEQERSWRDADAVARRRDLEDAVAHARSSTDAAIERVRAELRSAERRADLRGERAEVFRRLVELDELEAARRLLHDDEAVPVHPIVDEGRSWPYRYQSLSEVVHQFDSERDRYPLARDFVPLPDDEDGRRLVTALRSLDPADEAATSAYVEAVQRLVAQPGVDRRLRPVATDGEAATTHRCDLILPTPPTLPSLRWTGGSVPVAVGEQPVPDTLFRLSLQVSPSRSHSLTNDPVVDVAAVLSLLARDGERTASQELRGIRLLRAVCAELPLRAVVEPSALGRLHSADARVRLWTLMHVLGFEVDDVARASLVAVAGDHPHLLWHLLDTAERELREPSQENPAPSARWDTARLMAREDFDAIVRRAVTDDLADPVARAALAAVAVLSPDAGTAEDVATLISSAAGDIGDQQSLAGAVTADVIRRELSVLRARCYVTGPGDDVRLHDSVVGRSLARFEPEQWLEDAVTEVLGQLTDPAAALVKDMAHSFVQRYRLGGDDPQQLGPRDVVDPDVPCWASRWAEIVVATSSVQDLYRDEHISVASDVASDLWVPGPSVDFALLIDNLVHNARTALGRRGPDDPGRVMVSVQPDPEPGWVRVEVSDNGSGLPSEISDGIRDGALRPRGGRGHGLHHVIGSAREHGWEVSADRDPYLGGARLTVRLPRLALQPPG